LDGELVAEVPSIAVSELKVRLDRGDDLALLDVRRPEESAIASIGGTLIPVDELEPRLAEIESLRNREIVVICRTGARSSRAVRLLERHGFLGARNLAGGIRAWSEEIDPSVPVY
jgi:adenylyltransferase/sulfurtransferase